MNPHHQVIIDKAIVAMALMTSTIPSRNEKRNPGVNAGSCMEHARCHTAGVLILRKPTRKKRMTMQALKQRKRKKKTAMATWNELKK